jgi:hypothetical protein
MDNGDRQMTITNELNAMFDNTQKLAGLIKDDPNPYRSAYVRLIGELESVLNAAHYYGSEKTRATIESQLSLIIIRQRAEIAKREEDAEVTRRIENFSE